MYHGDAQDEQPNAEGKNGAVWCDWSKAQATDEIRAIARSRMLTISYKDHAVERIAERDIIIGDVLYVLKNGFVHMDPTPSTRPPHMKYAMEGLCPNGGSRALRVIVVPQKPAYLKIVSVMWVDEVETRSGTFIGEADEHPSLHRKRPEERLHRRS